MATGGSTNSRVLVVGAGPAGLVAAITLARYGVQVLVVDKRRSISTLSRATVISTRCMEIFRSWGLEEQIRDGAADVESRGWVTPSLASGEGYEIPLGYPTQREAAAISPTHPAWAPQDHLEPLLLGLLRSHPSAEVRFGTELLALTHDDDGIRARVRSDDGSTQWLAAPYVIGADGAHSAVRAQTGIAMEGADNLAEYHRVEFRAPLSPVCGDRRYGLYVITNPDAAGTLTPRGNRDRWALSREWTPGQPRMADCAPDEIGRLIAAATGVESLVAEVERVSAFSFAAQIAARYRQGRIFLIGDAAHRMTPRGGTGMNTAIQDAFDLGWKIAWVQQGWANACLLDSYEAERRPVGAHNVMRAGQRDGAQREAADALPWDLNDRLTHQWVSVGGVTVSSLDLLGDGLTVLAGPEAPGRARLTNATGYCAPLTVHRLDAGSASSLRIGRTGVRLLRPDGRPFDFSGSRWQPSEATHDGLAC